MPQHPIVGLDEAYRVQGDREGKRFVLVKPDWDCLHKIKNYDHFPTLEECKEAIKEYDYTRATIRICGNDSKDDCLE